MAVSLGYGTVGSNKLEAAKAFYDALLGSAGLVPLFEHPSGGRLYGHEGKPVFGVLGPYDKRAATIGNGSMFAFRLDTPDAVQAFHGKAITLGGTCEGPPGERGPKMYFSYFRDLDGNKLCAYCMG
jgi:catechol 2,3-dioxygenase-like lactoylglutathione lyase family enzyme